MYGNRQPRLMNMGMEYEEQGYPTQVYHAPTGGYQQPPGIRATRKNSGTEQPDRRPAVHGDGGGGQNQGGMGAGNRGGEPIVQTPSTVPSQQRFRGAPNAGTMYVAADSFGGARPEEETKKPTMEEEVADLKSRV